MRENTYRFCLWKTLLYWGIVLGGIALCVFLFFHDPTKEQVTFCLFHAATGLDCPGCGMTRASYCLLHGRLLQAFCYHPFVYFLPPFGYFVLAEMSPHLFLGHSLPRLNPPLWSLFAVGGMLLAYTVIRNVVKFL